MTLDTISLNDGDELLELANNLRISRQYEEAIKFYEKYLEINVPNADTFSYIGIKC